jgi:hypothetical protein
MESYFFHVIYTGSLSLLYMQILLFIMFVSVFGCVANIMGFLQCKKLSMFTVVSLLGNHIMHQVILAVVVYNTT